MRSLAKKAKLREEESIGIVLYTGPMYEIYNCILNQRSEDPLWNLFQHNRFPTTLSAIVSAIQKIGAVTPVNLDEKLYRRNGGSQYLPSSFFERDDMNVRGMAPYGFQSFTASIDNALEYAKPVDHAQLPMVFVIRPSSDPLTGFADVSGFSQYPQEREFLLPPLAFLLPDSTCKPYQHRSPKYGNVDFVPMRVIVSKSPSLEELERKKQDLHIAEFVTRVAELRDALQTTARKHNAEHRLLYRIEQDQKQFWKGKEHTVDSFIESIVMKVQEVLQRHMGLDYMDFNRKRYAAIIQEELDCLRMALSLLKLWLKDKSKHIHRVNDYKLLHGHRQYVTFLKMQHQNEPTKKRARKFCNHLSLLGASEQTYGETPLMEAAALGRGVQELELLVAAGEDVHATNPVKGDGECALHLAAENGHDHGIRALLRLGASIDQPYTSGDGKGRTALHRACLNAHSDCVATLATLKADLNKRCAVQGRTPLFNASQKGYPKCIEELVRHGADLDLVDSDNFTALYLACLFGQRFSVASLLANGAKANLESQWYSPLWMASKKGYHQCVQEFSRVSDVNLFPTAANPLIVTIAEQNGSCVDDLLRLQPPQAHVFHALLAAIWFVNWESVRRVLDNGANRGLNLLQVKDEDGLSAEQFAAVCGRDELELALLHSSSATVANANVPLTSIQEQSHWKMLTGPPDSLCVTRCDTLRCYRYTTAVAIYGCRDRDCAYFEVTLRCSGPKPQFGLCSGDYAARCRSQIDGAALKRVLSVDVLGVGDTNDSWAVDGIRGKKMHNKKKQEWGAKWRQGDVIGIACNMQTRQMIVSLNGDYSAPNGIVFDLPRNARVMYPALFMSIEGHVRANHGHEPFQHAKPSQDYVAFAALPPFEDKK